MLISEGCRVALGEKKLEGVHVSDKSVGVLARKDGKKKQTSACR